MKILLAIVLSFIFATGAYSEMTAVTGIATTPKDGSILIESSPGVYEWVGPPVSDPSVKYEVTFKVVYNAVSAERAAEISKEIMIKHQDACKVEVRSVKNGGDTLTLSNDTTNYIISSQPRWVVTE